MAAIRPTCTILRAQKVSCNVMPMHEAGKAHKLSKKTGFEGVDALALCTYKCYTDL